MELVSKLLRNSPPPAPAVDEMENTKNLFCLFIPPGSVVGGS